MKITKLELENVKRVRAVEITPAEMRVVALDGSGAKEIIINKNK